jgi:hypothetical protein
LNPFRYAVSLRIWHPSIDPAVISDTLRLESKHTSKKELSFWTHACATHEDTECAAFIQSAAAALLPHADFFRRPRCEGGRAEFFTGCFGDKNFGETFPHFEKLPST